MKKVVLAFALFAACGIANAQTETTTTTTEDTSASSSDSSDRLDKGGFYLEPMVTYQTGEATLHLPSPINDQKQDMDGFGAGLRAGFHISQILFVAADARYSWLEFDDFDTKGWNIGPVLGVQMPKYGLRLWGTYVLGGELEQDETQDLDAKFTDPKGYRLGAGIHVKSVSLNLEYQNLTYNKFKGEAAGITGNFDSDADDKSWIASVSFPIEL